MIIRRATIEDAGKISALIKSLAQYFAAKADGSVDSLLLTTIEPQAINSYIECEKFQYFVGVIDAQIVGVMAVREESHLFHFFVAESWQGKGLARSFWEHARQRAATVGIQRITVNSSLFAVPIYERFGFNKLGEKRETKGIAYVPMVVDLSSDISAKLEVSGDYFNCSSLKDRDG